MRLQAAQAAGTDISVLFGPLHSLRRAHAASDQSTGVSLSGGFTRALGLSPERKPLALLLALGSAAATLEETLPSCWFLVGCLFWQGSIPCILTV